MTEENTNTGPSLTVGDLTLTANIIDLAVQRGAFKGAELTTVGNAFDKIITLLKAIAPEAVEAPEAKAEENSEED
jgi:hypothetical protein